MNGWSWPDLMSAPDEVVGEIVAMMSEGKY